MRTILKASTLVIFLAGSLPAVADHFYFSYTFDGSTPFGSRGPGTVLTAVVDGTLQADDDTITINKFISATLDGIAYDIGETTELRGYVPGSDASMSLSGDAIDMWVCADGFKVYTENGGDCAFGVYGGFLLNNTADDLALLNFAFLSGDTSLEQTLAWAGIPELTSSFRAGDIPMNNSNWEAGLLDADGDGVSDDNDSCPVTTTAATVSILGVDSGVANFVFAETGCSVGDTVELVVSDCLDSAGATQFASCTTRGFNNLKDSGVITGREKGALQSAAAKSVGKGKD